jgi:hypothetical protein
MTVLAKARTKLPDQTSKEERKGKGEDGVGIYESSGSVGTMDQEGYAFGILMHFRGLSVQHRPHPQCVKTLA